MLNRFSLILFFLTALVCCASNPNEQKYTEGEQTPANVFYAPLPSELDFAGESVPLNYPDVREALQREISVTMYMHSRSLMTLRNMERYFAIIVPMLKENGIPEDFKYLAMAESGLNPEAVSSAKAGGLWQIMKGTAKHYGVETGDNIDLRFNVEVSTKAAIKYLKEAYSKFGNWTMVAASYNLGMAGVQRRMTAQRVNDYYSLFLPEETARYVYRILAMKLVGDNPQQYGFKLKDEDYLKPFENYNLETINSENIVWSDFAIERGTTYKTLRLLNPWIRSYEYANKPKTTYTVKVPKKNFRENGF